MPLQSSAEISFANINTELGRAADAQIGLNEAEAGTYATINTNSSSRPNGTTPNSMNEWWGYNHSAAAAIECVCWTVYNEGGGTGNYSYNRCSNGDLVSANIPAGSGARTICAQINTTPYQNTGLLTIIYCGGATCFANAECDACS